MTQLVNTLDNNQFFIYAGWNSPIMTDFYLSFTSEEEANTILFTETIVDDVVIPPTAEGYTVDVLGFTELYPTQYLVNLRGADTEIWQAYQATPDPQIPLRVFA